LFHADTKTDRQTDRQTVAFRNFAKAPSRTNLDAQSFQLLSLLGNTSLYSIKGSVRPLCLQNVKTCPFALFNMLISYEGFHVTSTKSHLSGSITSTFPLTGQYSPTWRLSSPGSSSYQLEFGEHLSTLHKNKETQGNYCHSHSL
jgi:hypothetical protein